MPAIGSLVAARQTVILTATLPNRSRSVLPKRASHETAESLGVSRACKSIQTGVPCEQAPTLGAAPGARRRCVGKSFDTQRGPTGPRCLRTIVVRRAVSVHRHEPLVSRHCPLVSQNISGPQQVIRLVSARGNAPAIGHVRCEVGRVVYPCHVPAAQASRMCRAATRNRRWGQCETVPGRVDGTRTRPGARNRMSGRSAQLRCRNPWQ